MYALLKDGTRVDNLTESSTPTDIVVIRSNYGEAASVRDLFTDENASIVRLFNGDGTEVAVGTNLIILDGANLISTADGVLCEFHLREKSEIEKLKDEIAELQDVILS